MRAPLRTHFPPVPHRIRIDARPAFVTTGTGELVAHVSALLGFAAVVVSALVTL